MTPGVANYQEVLRGNTVNAKRFALSQTIDNTENAIDLTGVNIKAAFRAGSKELIKTIGEGITVIDAVGGIFEIDAFILTVAGEYHFDIKFTFPDGKVKTYIKGVLPIIESVTL